MIYNKYDKYIHNNFYIYIPIKHVSTKRMLNKQ